MRRQVVLVMIVLMTSATLAGAASLQNVQNKIAKKTAVERLQVREENGKVILEGLASTLWDKTQAGKIASKETKMAVDNEIAVQSAPKSDREIALDVEARLRDVQVNTYLFNSLSVESHDGEVVLQGKLRDAYLKDFAVKAAMKTPGVRAVVDRIQLLALGDDQLRTAVYARLLRDGRISGYFNAPNPPINIIVENSRVTLIGHVNTELDRVQAGRIAGETKGVLSVDNQLQVGS
ncbi:MAG: hypothetical protein C5B54_04580 [Acidobacteria bacterium]|nr:MAG: hypothetical protein C5B54_04580 [Acidobacteriota bacterium]